MPLMYGSTTHREAATATAASKALPPASRTSRPARVASGWAELTIPFVPTAARVGVLLLAGPSRSSGPATVVGGAGSAVVSPSALFVPRDGVRSGTTPTAEVRRAVSPPGEPPPAPESPPQEQSTNATNATRNGFFGTRTGCSTPFLLPTRPPSVCTTACSRDSRGPRAPLLNRDPYLHRICEILVCREAQVRCHNRR